MDKPRIITKLIRKDNKIIKMSIKDTIKKIGRSGYIALPKELIGKYVEVIIRI